MIDNALTRPWTVVREYQRNSAARAGLAREFICAEGNGHVRIGNENYYMSADGLADAGAQGPGAAGSALFPVGAEVVRRTCARSGSDANGLMG